MRRSSPSSVASSKRIDQLAAAFSAFRSSHGAGRRIPLGLRRQFLAALDAGEPARALRIACRCRSAGLLSRWARGVRAERAHSPGTTGDGRAFSRRMMETKPYGWSKLM